MCSGHLLAAPTVLTASRLAAAGPSTLTLVLPSVVSTNMCINLFRCLLLLYLRLKSRFCALFFRLARLLSRRLLLVRQRSLGCIRLLLQSLPTFLGKMYDGPLHLQYPQIKA